MIGCWLSWFSYFLLYFPQHNNGSDSIVDSRISHLTFAAVQASKRLTAKQIPSCSFLETLVVPVTQSALLQTGTGRLKPDWPFPFETHGSLFIFQPSTGYFFEPNSEFYYCPRSKFYYRVSDGSYFQLVSSQFPLDPFPFIRFDPPLPNEDEEALSVENNSQECDSSQSKITRKPVMMSIGTKNKAKIPSSNAINLSKKTAIVDIAKWEAIKVEDLSIDQLCRRQFTSAAQLTRHENESKLHKENFLRQDQAV